jgi:hypothetical protein
MKLLEKDFRKVYIPPFRIGPLILIPPIVIVSTRTYTLYVLRSSSPPVLTSQSITIPTPLSLYPTVSLYMNMYYTIAKVLERLNFEKSAISIHFFFRYTSQVLATKSVIRIIYTNPNPTAPITILPLMCMYVYTHAYSCA